MKASELRAKSAQELNNLKLELLREQLNLRVQRSTSQMTKHHLFRAARLNLARINTILNEKDKAS